MIHRSEFINPCKQSMGIEKANSLFQDLITELGLPSVNEYTPEQAKRILDHMKTKGGLTRILALNLTTRMVMSGLIPFELFK